MGNVSSNDGNNFIIDSKGDQKQTPLNEFVEKVMNKDYFFSPNVSDDMIINLDKDDINNKQVLLKRALCTGTTYVPISLPYVDESGNIKNYTLKINATDEDGNKLPNIEDITEENYNKAHNTASKIINGSLTEDDIETDSHDNNNARTVLEYLRIQNSLDDGSEYKYYTTVDKDKSNARVGNTLGCKNFYIGEKTNGDKINYERDEGYNDFDKNDTNLSTSDGFCGKVFQYNNLIKKNIEEKINGVDDLIGDYTRTDDGSLTYRQNEFIDCNCLNSELIVKYTSNTNIKGKIINEAGQISDLDPHIEPQDVAQNNIAMCKTNLHTGLGAYAYKNRKNDYNLTLCQSVKYLNDVDLNAESILNLKNECYITPTIGVGGGVDVDVGGGVDVDVGNDGGNDGDDNKNDDKKNNNTTIIIAVVVGIVLIAIIGAIIYLLYNKNKSNSDNSKYVRPASDPLYRVINKSNVANSKYVNM